MIDSTEVDTPGWWLARLMRDLEARRPRLERLARYADGDCDLPEGAAGCREAYRTFQRRSRTNFAALVVEAVQERMIPSGFRTGASEDADADAVAWRLWQANSLDADSTLVHRAALTMGDSFVIVGPGEAGELPLITPEDPREVLTAHDPLRRRTVTAAVKVFRDRDHDEDVAYLYLPGRVLQARRSAKPSSWVAPVDHVRAGGLLGGWEWTADDPVGVPVVPVVRFALRPKLGASSLGEFEDSIDVLDRINHMLLQRMVIATMQAFRQRAIKGVPDVDEAGELIDYDGMFSPSAGSLWMLPENAEIVELGQADIGGILQAVRHDIQDLAAVTRTPLHYLTPDAANGSAEGASLAREGLVFKCGDRIKQASESWEQVMSLAFAFAGDEQRAARRDMETLWAPPERHSLAERLDAASKALPAGVPWRTVMSDVLQFSPQQVSRMAAERAASTPDPRMGETAA
jgi:hypothetical protein